MLESKRRLAAFQGLASGLDVRLDALAAEAEYSGSFDFDTQHIVMTVDGDGNAMLSFVPKDNETGGFTPPTEPADPPPVEFESYQNDTNRVITNLFKEIVRLEALIEQRFCEFLNIVDSRTRRIDALKQDLDNLAYTTGQGQAALIMAHNHPFDWQDVVTGDGKVTKKEHE